MRLIAAILVLLLCTPAIAAKKKAKEPPKQPEQSQPVEQCLGVPFDDVALERIKASGFD